jgi:hypothetical protein
MRSDLQLFIRRTKTSLVPEKDNVVKETMRYVSQFFFERQQHQITFLTLPSAWWKFEMNMQNHISGVYGGNNLTPPYLRFIGFEREWKIFQLASINIPKDTYNRPLQCKRDEELNCSIVTNSNKHVLYNCDVFEYLKLAKSRKVEDDHRCDVVWLDLTVAITHVAEKLHHIKNVMKKDSIIILTLMKAREHLKLPLEREEYIDSIMLPLGLEKIKTFVYKDTTPMIHIIYKQSDQTVYKQDVL